MKQRPVLDELCLKMRKIASTRGEALKTKPFIHQVKGGPKKKKLKKLKKKKSNFFQLNFSISFTLRHLLGAMFNNHITMDQIMSQV